MSKHNKLIAILATCAPSTVDQAPPDVDQVPAPDGNQVPDDVAQLDAEGLKDIGEAKTPNPALGKVQQKADKAFIDEVLTWLEKQGDDGGVSLAFLVFGDHAHRPSAAWRAECRGRMRALDAVSGAPEGDASGN